MKVINTVDQFKQNVEINHYNECILNTFKYMFNKFKVGIFVHIKDGKLHKYIPFDNKNYINEYASKLVFENDVMKESNKYFLMSRNGVIDEHEEYDFEYMYKMLNRCLDLYKIFDCTFFINPTKFPILKSNYTEPYDNVWSSEIDLISHKYDLYADILSMTSSTNFLDTSIPTLEDYKRVFDKTLYSDEIEWKNKIDKAVFRGMSTGLGTTLRNNPRLKVLKIGQENPDMFDVGITKWDDRYRKRCNDVEYNIVSDKIVKMYSLSDEMTFLEQGAYKYILNLPDYSSTFELGNLFKLNSVVLHVPNTEYHMWYEHLLKPYIHYVPIDKDLKNLKTQIQWCRNNQKVCQSIIKNVRQFYKEQLTIDKQLLHLYHVLSTLHNYYLQEKSKVPSLPIVDFISQDDLQQVNDVNSVEKFFITKDGKYFMKKNSTPYFDYTIPLKHLYNSYYTHDGQFMGWRKVYGIYDYSDTSYLAMELIEPNKFTTLYEYIVSSQFDFTVVQDCILQVCLLLNNAYTTTKVIHNNFDLWSIMLNVDYGGKTVYIQNGKEEYVFNTSCTLYIIEYENMIQGSNYECKDVFSLLVNLFYLILINIHYYPQHVVQTITQLYHEIFKYSKSKTLQDMIECLQVFKNTNDINLRTINDKIDLTNYMEIYSLLQTYFMTNVYKRPIKNNVNNLFQQYISLKEI